MIIYTLQTPNMIFLPKIERFFKKMLTQLLVFFVEKNNHKKDLRNLARFAKSFLTKETVESDLLSKKYLLFCRRFCVYKNPSWFVFYHQLTNSSKFTCFQIFNNVCSSCPIFPWLHYCRRHRRRRFSYQPSKLAVNCQSNSLRPLF